MTLPKTDQLRKLLPNLRNTWGLDDLVSAALDLHTKGHPELEPFRTALLHLPQEEILALRREIDEAERQKQKDEAKGTPAAPRGDGVWTLEQERVLCGKGNCRVLHGPYWYGYRTVGGKVKKKYFGKKKPSEAKLAAAAAAMLQKEIERVAAAAKKPKKKKK